MTTSDLLGAIVPACIGGAMIARPNIMNWGKPQVFRMHPVLIRLLGVVFLALAIYSAFTTF